ncbi:universal stress protein [Streptomyces sp. NPDC054813]
MGPPRGPTVPPAASNASLVVVGRRVRRAPLGSRIGPVTDAVLRHAAAPVALVPHDRPPDCAP